MKNIGIIGAGARGKLYLEILNKYFPDRGKVVAIADPVLERLEGLGGITTYKNYQNLLEYPNLDAVIITTPDYTHTEIAIASFKAGKDILCEKPLSTTILECDEILKASQEANKMLQVGLILRYTSFYQTLKKIIAEGMIGSLKIASVYDYYPEGRRFFRRWHRFVEKSGGLLVHKACHTFDILNWLSNSIPKTLMAFGKLDIFKPKTKSALYCSECPEKYTCFDSIFNLEIDREWIINQKKKYQDIDLCVYNSEKNTNDNNVVIIEYENGFKVSYADCFFSTYKDRFYSLVGDKGEIKASQSKSEINVSLLSDKKTITYHCIPATDGDKNILIDFFDSLYLGKQPLADGEAGKWAVVVGASAEKSVQEKKVINCSIF